jgi:hypothetical protein
VTEKKQFGLKPKAKPAQLEPPSGKDVFQTAPAGKRIKEGVMPLPPGEIVRSVGGYTEEELRTLQTIPGWTPEKGVPSNLPDVLEQVKASVAEELDQDIVPPVDLDTPPLHVPKAVDISKLPPEERDRVLSSIQEAEVFTQRRKEQAANSVTNLAPGARGINEAISGKNVREVDVADDRDEPTYAGTDIPKTAAPTARERQASRTGATEPLVKNCPHCQWPLAEPDIPEPDLEDRRSYLASVLGQTKFQKHYSLMGKQLSVVFRELSPREVDLCYKQAHLMRRAGKIDSYEDFFEMLQRFRLVLQLVEIRTPDIVHNFPETVEGWAESNGEQVETTDGTILPQIVEAVYSDIIKSETMGTMLGKELARFNRLLAKLEANAHNENFWSTIVQAS